MPGRNVGLIFRGASMKIRFLIGLAGADFAFHASQIADVEDAWAVNLIAGGLAESVVEPDGKQDLHATGDGAGDISGSQRVPSIRRKRS